MNNPIDLDEAADRISSAQTDDWQSKPFFFLVGAGISMPPVLTAKNVIAACRQRLANRNKTIPEAQIPPSVMEQYSFWLEKAYPEPIDRQRYIESLIGGKSISWANFLLAQLLSQGLLANVVVTPNFDDFLSRALTVFIRSFKVCDHPATAWRINPQNKDIQILHVHGSYQYYDIKNLSGEVKRAGQSNNLRTVLDQVLYNSSPLVLGYSGWEGDIIMTSLKKRLYTGTEENALPRSLYWFCYERSELEGDTLPEWLKAHSQVFFVARPAPPAVGGTSDDSRSGQSGTPDVLRQRSERVTDVAGKGENPQQLPADVVLEKLISSCGSKTPELLKDPLGKLASHLFDSFLKDADKSGDRYGIGSIIQRIYTAKKLLEAEEQTNEIRLKAEKALDSARRLQHREAIQAFAGVNNYDALSREQLKDLLSAMWAAANGLLDNSDDEFIAYEQVVALGDALKVRDQLEPEGAQRAAKALYNQAVMLTTREQFDTALAVYENLLAQFDKLDEPSYQELVAQSFINEAWIYFNRKEYELAVNRLKEVISRFADSTTDWVRVQVAYAHNGIGFDMLREAKKIWQDGNETAARQKLVEALVEINHSLRYAAENAFAWGNLGYIQFLQGQHDEAQISLTKAVQFGGEELKQLEIEDSHMNEIPALDEQFRALVNSITVRPLEPPPVTPPDATPAP